MKILAISGSLRAVSSNTTLLRAAALLAPAGMEVVLYGGLGHWAFLLVGWTLTGLLIGASIGVYSYLMRVARSEDTKHLFFPPTAFCTKI